MSTVEHTASTEVGKIPLGRRIAELMEEKGEAFSIRAFSARIGMSREMLRRIIAGDRTVLPSELENIASGLGITIDRLKQVDTFKKEQELVSLLKSAQRTKAMMLHAEKLGREIAKVARGITERGLSITNLGRAQFYLQHYDEAHASWLTAMEFAERASIQYKDSTLLYHVTSFLLISYTLRKEYTNILDTLNVVENAFEDDPLKMGYANYTRMKWHEHRGDLEKAKEYAYLALNFFEKTNDKEQIGKAMINVAHFEYHSGNYTETEQILFSAIYKLKMYDYARLFAVKDYVKTLLKMGDRTKASKVVMEYVDLAHYYPELQGKLQILLSIAEDNPSYAVAVSDDLSMSAKLRSLACKSLMEFYSSKRDAESMMRYYEKGRILSNKKGEFYDEEGF